MNFHQIQKQILEITCASERLGFQIMPQASNLLQARLFKISQQILEELGTDLWIKIDQLVLDLGNIPLNNWQNEVAFRYEHALRRELKKIAQTTPTSVSAPTYSKSSQANSLFELLDFYLKKGYLAWWCENIWKNEVGDMTPFSLKKLLIVLGKQQRNQLFEWLAAHHTDTIVVVRIGTQLSRYDFREVISALLPLHIAAEVIKIYQDLQNIFAQTSTQATPLQHQLKINLLRRVLAQSDKGAYFKATDWLTALIQATLSLEAQHNFWEKLAQIQAQSNSGLRAQLFKSQTKLVQILSKQQQTDLLKAQWKNAQNWETFISWLSPQKSSFFWKTLFPSQHTTIKEVLLLMNSLDWREIPLQAISQSASASTQIAAYLLAILWENRSKSLGKEELISLLIDEISHTFTNEHRQKLLIQLAAKAPAYSTLVAQKNTQQSKFPTQRTASAWQEYLQKEGLTQEVLQMLYPSNAAFIFKYLSTLSQLQSAKTPLLLWIDALMILQSQPRLGLALFVEEHLKTLTLSEESLLQLQTQLPTLSSLNLTITSVQEKTITLSSIFNQPEPPPEVLLNWLLGGADLPLSVQLRVIFSEKEKERMGLEQTLLDWIAKQPQQFEALLLKLGADTIQLGNSSLSFFSEDFRRLLLQKINTLFSSGRDLPSYRLNSNNLDIFFEGSTEAKVIFSLLAFIFQPNFDASKTSIYLADAATPLNQKKLLEELLQKTQPLTKEALRQTALHYFENQLSQILPARVEKLVALLQLYLKNGTILNNSYLRVLEQHLRPLVEQTLQNAVLRHFAEQFPKDFQFWVEALPLPFREKITKINPSLLEKTLQKIAQNQQKAHLEKIKKALAQNPLTPKTAKAITEIYVQNIGLVLLHPFLSRLFSRLGYLENREFKSIATAERGVHLLQYLSHKAEQPEEYELSLNKLLCGLPLDTPIQKQILLTKEEKDMAESLLEGVIQQWTILKNTSPDGLRGSFLMREGKISEFEQYWQMQVANKGIDVLLGQLPWGLSTFKLNWMPKLVQIDWKVP